MFKIVDRNGEPMPIVDHRRNGGTHQNLMGANLAGATLIGGFLGADFRNANLAGAKFPLARLTQSNFANADLTEAWFDICDTTGANFRDAILTGTKPPWRSYEMMAEIVRQAAGADAERLELADLILSRRGLQHGDWSTRSHPAFPWAHAACRERLTAEDQARHGFWRAIRPTP